jgi:hypothetical protein
MIKGIKYIVVIAILFTSIVNGQIIAPPPIPPPPPPGLPIDGGLFILLASGVLYGIKKSKE